MEHFALEILLTKDDNGELKPRETALELQDYFEEIMIDEYQDSNEVQELLLRSISGEDKGHYNRFMVGDVKQSIYNFVWQDLRSSWRNMIPIRQGKLQKTESALI